jgi:Glycosyl hydrolases family 2, TIM barrel domain/Glycosyl hydrolases family 2
MVAQPQAPSWSLGARIYYRVKADVFWNAFRIKANGMLRAKAVVRNLNFTLRPGTLVFALIFLLFRCVNAAGQERISLAGAWERWIGDQFYDSIVVPSSYRPLGTARLVRAVEFPPLSSDQRLLLRFEGIAGNGILRVNGHEVGTLAPLIRHTFDVTDEVKPGPNRIETEITDWQVPLGLGPTAAWESSGGIVYGAYAEIRSDPYVENARLSYTLSSDFSKADCTLDVFLRAAHARKVRVTAELQNGEKPVSSVQQSGSANAGASTLTIHWTLDNVHLWSPDDPQLYHLVVQLESLGGHDEFATDTGFRSLVIRGNKFLLNGRPFVFKGVARHGMWGGQGYTLTAPQMEQDFRTIKSMGANAVRLVHYPHAPEELQIAARTGIFVTQETGLTWIDFSKAPRTTLETGINVLERIVQRDWNNPAFFAALLANESTPTLEVMQEARQRVKALDPALFISMPGPSAPDHKLESMKTLFDDAGFDFYTTHPYSYNSDVFEQAVNTFGTSKPTLFTEWGGPVGKLPRMLNRQVKALGTLVQQGRLSGHFFWEWADMIQYSREDISMDPPVLAEGIVTEDRNVRHEAFSRLAELYRYDVGQQTVLRRTPVFAPAPHINAQATSQYREISLQAVIEGQPDAWRALDAACMNFWRANSDDYLREGGGHFWTWDAPSLQIGPVPFETAQVDGHTRALVVLTGRNVDIPVHGEADRLHFLGNVTAPDGYPTRGNLGEEMGSYTIVYSDGEQQPITLRWGFEVSRGNQIASATRLNTIALAATPAIDYVKDVSWEQYRTLLFTVPVKHKPIDRIAITVKPLPPSGPLISLPNQTGSGYEAGETALLVFAITAESAAPSH